MRFFKSNKIFLDSETVAERLRSARQAKKIKLEEAAKKLNIGYKYLNALEKGDYRKLPSGAYGKNFLREYALFLGLNYEELAKIFSAEINFSETKNVNGLFSNQVAKRSYFLAMPKIIRNIIVGLIIAVCFVYLGIRLNFIISPPELLVATPPENFITTNQELLVSGKSEPETTVIINGETVLAGLNGEFSKTVNLKIGINTITITASKKYGRSKTVIRQILLKNIE